MCAAFARMILLSMTKHTKAGSTVCAVWAKDFEIHPSLVVSSMPWLQVVMAWLLYGEPDALSDSSGCESAPLVAMRSRRGAPMCVDKNWIIDFRPAGFRSNI